MKYTHKKQKKTQHIKTHEKQTNITTPHQHAQTTHTNNTQPYKITITIHIKHDNDNTYTQRK